MIYAIDDDSSRHGSASCRNLLLTIDVRPFLSIPVDTPARHGAMQNENRIACLMVFNSASCAGVAGQLPLCGGMMPFENIEKSLHEGH